MAAAELASSPAATAAVRRLSLAGRVRLATEIVIAYLRAQRELRRAPITVVVERLRSTASVAPAGGAGALEEALRLGRAVSRTLVLLPGDTRCLRRSLVLLRLLTRRGISARLVIAARTDPDFLAHAWVEHDGVPVLVPASDSFGRLVEL
jgi:hypothetical protein